MKPRIWALAAVVWAAFYVGLYIAVVHGKQGGVYAVYGLLVTAGALLVLPTGLLGPTLRRTNLLLVALVLFVLATLWATFGSKGFGLLLIPSVVATGRALSKISREGPPTAAPS